MDNDLSLVAKKIGASQVHYNFKGRLCEEKKQFEISRLLLKVLETTKNSLILSEGSKNIVLVPEDKLNSLEAKVILIKVSFIFPLSDKEKLTQEQLSRVKIDNGVLNLKINKVVKKFYAYSLVDYFGITKEKKGA